MKLSKYIILTILFGLFICSFSVVSASSVISDGNVTTVTIPSYPYQFAMVWGTNVDNTLSTLNDTNYTNLISSTSARGQVDTGYTAMADGNDGYYTSYTNIIDTSLYGVVSLCFLTDRYTLNNYTDYEIAYLAQFNANIETTMFSIYKMRFSIRPVVDGNVLTVVQSTEWFTPVMYSKLNNSAFYRYVDQSFAGRQFTGSNSYNTVALCIDLLFHNNESLESDASIGIELNDVATDIVYIDRSGETNAGQFPPGFINPIYPNPPVQDDVAEKEILNNSNSKLNALFPNLTSLADKVSGAVSGLIAPFTRINTMYDKIVTKLPAVGTLIDISLYFGLGVIILGITLSHFGGKK